MSDLNAYLYTSQRRNQEFFGKEGLTKSVEDRGQREWGLGAVAL
jgi:hypothetical protein